MAEKIVSTPLGEILIVEKDGALTNCHFTFSKTIIPNPDPPSVFLKKAEKAIGKYFNGNFESLEEIPVSFQGTVFQTEVWEKLRKIPASVTLSYSEIAEAIGRPLASRAVGMACNRNPILLFIPCHRIVGKNKSLTGFNGGVDKKQFLLELEGSVESSKIANE